MRIVIIIMCFSLLSCAMRSRNDSKRAHLHLKIGTAHLSNGNFPAALSELLKAEKMDSDNPVIQNNLGLAYFVRKKWDKAEFHIRKAIELEPNYTEARNNLGKVLIQSGNHKEAIQQLKIAAEDLTYQFPEKTYSNLGRAWYHLKDYNKALENLKRSLDMRRQSCNTYTYYGKALFALHDFSKSAPAFDRAIALCKNKNFDEPHYYSALSYYKLGQPESAISRLEEQLEQYPTGKYSAKAQKLLSIMR
jgi:type IV pilus assembly protein PilF